MKPVTVASIRTRFHGPTNRRPSHIRVSDGGAFGAKARTIQFAIGCHAGRSEEQHRDAAQAWLDKYNSESVVSGPGYGFDNDYHWTWERVEGGGDYIGEPDLGDIDYQEGS